MNYFIGLTHFSADLSVQVLIRLPVQAFIFTNGNDKKYTSNGAKREGKKKDFEVLDKSIDYGVRQALNQILAMPLTNWLP